MQSGNAKDSLLLCGITHTYLTDHNRNRSSRHPNGQCTRVFVDKLKDMELSWQKVTGCQKEPG